MEEVLALMAAGRLSLEGLEGVTFPFERAPDAYELLKGESGAPPIAVVLDYGPVAGSIEGTIADTSVVPGKALGGSYTPVASRSRFDPRQLDVSFVGMGNFASASMLPAVRGTAGVALQDVVTASPLKAEAARRRAGFHRALTNATDAITAADTSVVFIATRHDTHARFAEEALRAGKAVFVEKPLALTLDELNHVARALEDARGRLMVGFNRRFAPATRWALAALGSNREGLRFLARVNAGALPSDHWLLDPQSGGGRLLGEACHFLDLATCFAASRPVEVHGVALDVPREGRAPQSFHLTVRFENDATAGIEYVSHGDPSLPKERIEIHRHGTSVVIDDFRVAECYRAGKRSRRRWQTRDKGHGAEVRAFLEAVRTGAPTPIPESESLESTALTLAAARSIREGRPLTRSDW